MGLISDQKIAILAATGVYHSDLAIAREHLEKNGISTCILSHTMPEIRTWSGDDWAARIKVDGSFEVENPDHFDGVFIPGGIIHADDLQNDHRIRAFLLRMHESNRPIGAIGHGVQLLIDEGLIEGIVVSCPITLSAEVRLAGGIPTDQQLAADNGIVTCKSETNIEEFVKLFIDVIVAGVRADQSTDFR